VALQWPAQSVQSLTGASHTCTQKVGGVWQTTHQRGGMVLAYWCNLLWTWDGRLSKQREAASC
jgi:hypothetical protein